MSDAWALVREIRRRARMTQRELAAAARTTPATVARIEKGRMEPTVALLARIARAGGFELGLVLRAPDPDERSARLRARKLTDEQRLRQNDRLSRLRVGRA